MESINPLIREILWEEDDKYKEITPRYIILNLIFKETALKSSLWGKKIQILRWTTDLLTEMKVSKRQWNKISRALKDNSRPRFWLPESHLCSLPNDVARRIWHPGWWSHSSGSSQFRVSGLILVTPAVLLFGRVFGFFLTKLLSLIHGLVPVLTLLFWSLESEKRWWQLY